MGQISELRLTISARPNSNSENLIPASYVQIAMVSLGVLTITLWSFAKSSNSYTLNRTPEFFELPDADRELFGKFVLSVLWRASISKRSSVAVVKLGPYEMKFRDVIFSSRSINEIPEAEIILERYTVRRDVDPAGIYFYPTRFKMAGLNFYNFAVGGFRIRTKVDNRPLPTEIRPLSISSGRVWGTFCLFEETSEFEGIINLMRRHRGQ